MMDSANAFQLIGSVFRKYNYKKRPEKKITSKSDAPGLKTILAGYVLGLYTFGRKFEEF